MGLSAGVAENEHQRPAVRVGDARGARPVITGAAEGSERLAAAVRARAVLSPRDTWPDLRVTFHLLPWTWRLRPRPYVDDVEGWRGFCSFAWLFLDAEWWANGPMFTERRSSRTTGEEGGGPRCLWNCGVSPYEENEDCPHHGSGVVHP